MEDGDDEGEGEEKEEGRVKNGRQRRKWHHRPLQMLQHSPPPETAELLPSAQHNRMFKMEIVQSPCK